MKQDSKMDDFDIISSFTCLMLTFSTTHSYQNRIFLLPSNIMTEEE